jgi:ABC-type molybdate transport system substrate-binding protein
VTFVLGSNASEQEPLRLYAAGSLRGAMTEVARAFTAASAQQVTTVFGASGLLRERIAKSEAADVFASADVGNAQKLAQVGRASTRRSSTRVRVLRFP